MKKKLFLFNGLEQKIMWIYSKSIHRIEWHGIKESTVSLSKLVNVNFDSSVITAPQREVSCIASIITAFWREVSWKSFSSFCFIKWLVLYFRSYCMSHTYTHKNAPYWSDVWSLYSFIRRFARYLVGIYRRYRKTKIPFGKRTLLMAGCNHHSGIIFD